MSKAKTITLLEAYDQDLDRFRHRVGKDRSERSLRAMQQGRQYVAAFLIDWLHIHDIQLAQLMPQFINDFSVYLSTDRGLRGGTIWLACQLLKGVVTRAHVRGMLKWNPFGQFHIAKNIRPREYLTEEEIAQLMTHDFKKPALSFARDIFILAAFTGLAFIDIKELKTSVQITRFKGLGEISSDEFVDFIGENMRLDLVKLADEESISDIMEFYMGDNTIERQNFIRANLKSEEELEDVNI